MAGLYVHVPFCHSKCAYCDFYSMGNHIHEDRYVAALLSEWDMRRRELSQPFKTIYIGGGTPSSLSEKSLTAIIEALPHTDIAELTLEANPEDVNIEKARFWRGLGINRISMGIQSLNDDELKAIGRRHTSAEACHAIETLQAGGFDNLNLDLIFGLPLQTLTSLSESLTRLLSYSPSHLSAYMLSYELGTRLELMLRRGQLTETPDDVLEKMYQLVCETTRSQGYEHYEISNYSKPGCRAIHNSNYWNNQPYLGLGPSAHSYDGETRRANVANLKKYLSCLENSQPAYEVEEETVDNKFNETVMLALRTSQGLNLQSVLSGRYDVMLRDARKWLDQGKLIIEDNFLKIPEKHWLVSDAIISDLFQ